MNTLAALKTENDDFQVEYEMLSPIDIATITNPTKREIALALQDVNNQIDLCEEEITKLSVEIDKLTNHADGIDYAVAVASGILTGLIDSFFVGDYNPSIEDIVTEFAKKKAKKQGKNIDNYEEARQWLEDNKHVDHDGAYQPTKEQKQNNEKRKDVFGHDVTSNGHTHRLDDLAHHPTLIGLAASVFFQFFRIAFFVGKDGKLHPVFVKADMKKIAEMWIPAVLSGVLIWLANAAEKNNEKMGEDVPESIKKIVKMLAATPMLIKIFRCADTWISHIMSDVGPKADKSKGKGIPGIFLSFLKEISTLIPSPKLHDALQELYNGKTMNFDSELVMIEKLKKQAIPVMINEVIVRSFYFARRLISEYQEHKNFNDIDWGKTIPFGNRTVERMMTIASGTFTTVDIADAAIRGALESGGTAAGFVSKFVARINVVGVGRFVIAIGVDIGMGIKRNKLRNERMDTYNQMLMLSGAKVYYLEAGMWCSAIDTGKTLEKTMQIAEKSVAYFAESWKNMEEDMQIIGGKLATIVDNDSEFAQEILDELDY